MTPGPFRRPGHLSRGHGFSVMELLIALAITLLIAGALATLVQPARSAFDRVPAEADLQQRGRAAIDALAQTLRSSVAVSGPDPGEVSSLLTVVTPVFGGAQAALAADQDGPAGSLLLDATPCPSGKDICGFGAGTIAVITDDAGHYDVFAIASTNAAARVLFADRPLSQAYPSGSAVTEIDQYTFRLAQQVDGSQSLMRETAAGAVQPMVDFVSSLWFAVSATQVDVALSVQPPTAPLRRVLPDRVFRTSIRLRNAS